ncbi:MAG TPA: AI-2E family transporter [Nocardioidaceae bacterium]|nr:AI-2E family transporter [Nocardioidaceae bacterium]
MGPSFRKRTSVPSQPSGTAVQAATDGPGDATSWFQQAQPWFRRGVVFVLVAIALFQVAEWLFLGLRVFLGLLFLAWLFAISMEAVVAMLERRGVRRGLATGLVMLTLFLSIVIFLTAFGALLVTQLTELVQALPRSVSDAVDLVNRTVGTSFDASDVTGSLRLTPERIQQLVQTLTPGILGIVSSVLGVVFQFFTLLLFAFYMSAEMPKLRNSVASRFPARQQQVIVTVWAIAIEKAGGYVVSRFLLAGLSALLTGAFLALIGVPYWLPLAIWTGLVSQFIPTIGTYLAIALPAVIALAQQPIDAVWVIAFGVGYQQVENYFFSPRITARTISIHPAVAFGSVIVGAALFGPLGALVSIPVVAAIQAVVDTYGHRYDLAHADTEKPPLPTGPGKARPEPAGSG